MKSALLVLFCLALPAFAADGLVAVESARGAKDTMDRLESVAKERGLNVFARIDHAAGAAKVGRKLRATEVLIFGNPQGGTPLMECAQSAGIDLPLKASKSSATCSTCRAPSAGRCANGRWRSSRGWNPRRRTTCCKEATGR